MRNRFKGLPQECAENVAMSQRFLRLHCAEDTKFFVDGSGFLSWREGDAVAFFDYDFDGGFYHFMFTSDEEDFEFRLQEMKRIETIADLLKANFSIWREVFQEALSATVSAASPEIKGRFILRKKLISWEESGSFKTDLVLWDRDNREKVILQEDFSGSISVCSEDGFKKVIAPLKGEAAKR